jgi:biotin carboxyl carrier protein
MADGAPKVGLFLNPFDQIISMKVLNRRYVLRLPRGLHGRVTETFIPNAYTQVAYGQSLARLDPRALEAITRMKDAGGRTKDEANGDMFHPSSFILHPSKDSEGKPGTAATADLLTVEAPSDGIFYRRPSPDSPPYVEVGSPVSTGRMLGLVEIMKCFHHITYGGPGLPEKGEITKILATDASEVRFGQALFHVKAME